jgi:hypothetical protein
VVRALQAGNGRSNRCERAEELPGRLAEDGVTFDPDGLSEVITRLEDCGQLVRVQRQPFSAYPQYLVLKGDHPYDEVDALAADVCSTIKRRGDRFDSDDQLRGWLDEDGVSCTSGRLAATVYQLERIGRLKRPRADHWRSDLPLPGVYVDPRVYPE